MATYVGLVTGRLTLDIGIGRLTRPLGPIVVEIAAPQEIVYAAATAPYAERRPRAMVEKVRILERTDHMVLAAHHTPVGKRLTAITVETVTFDAPHRIGFRLVRGPVPLVTETFDLEPTATGTQLTYTGELGTDLGRLGELWGDLVTRSWINAVETSLASIKTESERRSS
ncbi:MAG: SRPBCC family protein [Actinomycetota bacterium]|nr:SRPBCC family protein [Actinomycetota bacterium]